METIITALLFLEDHPIFIFVIVLVVMLMLYGIAEWSFRRSFIREAKAWSEYRGHVPPRPAPSEPPKPRLTPLSRHDTPITPPEEK